MTLDHDPLTLPRHQSEMTLKTELYKPIEVKIPQSIKDDLRQGVEKFKQIVEEVHPDVVVGLQRLGHRVVEAVVPSVNAYLATKGSPPLKIVGANIGQEVASRFIHQEAEKADAKGEDLFANGLYQLSEHEKQYREWMSQDGYVQALVHRLQTDFQNQKITNPRSILIVDDTIYEGNTLRFSAPGIVAEAVNNGEIKPTIHTVSLIQNSDWASAVLEETFGKIGGAEWQYLRTLMGGYLEEEIPDGDQQEEGASIALIEIKSRKELEKLGENIENIQGVNPFVTLVARYGEKALLDFPKAVVEALRKAA